MTILGSVSEVDALQGGVTPSRYHLHAVAEVDTLTSLVGVLFTVGSVLEQDFISTVRLFRVFRDTHHAHVTLRRTVVEGI